MLELFLLADDFDFLLDEADFVDWVLLFILHCVYIYVRFRLVIENLLCAQYIVPQYSIQIYS